jgi:PAS domain-containing protein
LAELARQHAFLESELDSRKRVERTLSQQRQALQSSKTVLEMHVEASTLELEKLQDRYELILNSAGEGICGLDPHGKAAFVNPPVTRITGWSLAELIGKFAAYPLVLEDKLVGLMSLFTQHPLPEQILGEMASVANGIALCIERKRSEEALDRSEVKYRSVVDSIKEVIFQLDEFGNWVFVNPAWTAVTGFDHRPQAGRSPNPETGRLSAT